MTTLTVHFSILISKIPFPKTCLRIMLEILLLPLSYRLKTILEMDSLTAQMLKALSHVSQPEVVLSSHLNNLKKFLRDPHHLKEAFDEMCKEMFSFLNEPNSTDQTAISGRIFRDLANNKHEIEQYLNPLMSGNASSDAIKLACGHLNKLNGKLKQTIEGLRRNQFKSRSNLDAYSPFLTNFRGNMHSGFEIPGQYTGENMPLPHHHITVMHFEQMVGEFAYM
jgi:hypothetical protein